MTEIRVDWWIRISLVIIAGTLCWISIRPVVTPKEITASLGADDSLTVKVVGFE